MKPKIDFKHKNVFGPSLHVSVPDFIKVNKICSIFHRSFTKNQIDAGEAHNFWEVVRHVDGDSRLVADGKIYHLSPDEVFIYAPFVYHESVACPMDRTLEIFSFSSDSIYLERLANRPLKMTASQKKLFEMIQTRGANFMSKYPCVLTSDRELIQPEEGYPLVQTLANLIELFLVDLYEVHAMIPTPTTISKIEPENFQDDRLRRLTEYLEKNIQRTLTLEEICKDLNIGSASLQKLCKKHFGCGPVSYFLTLKIRMAKLMIADTPKNFSQIAEELGFSSIHYFSNLFKSRTGVSPSAYSKAIRRQ